MTGQTSSQIGSEKIATIRSEYSHVCFRNFLVSNFYLPGPFRFIFFHSIEEDYYTDKLSNHKYI